MKKIDLYIFNHQKKWSLMWSGTGSSESALLKEKKTFTNNTNKNQPGYLMTKTNILSEYMCTTKLQCPLNNVKSHTRNKWLIFSWFLHLKHDIDDESTTPWRIKLSFVGILLLKILEANNDACKGTALFHIIYEWISLRCSSVWVRVL